MWCGVVRCVAVQCSAVQCGAMRCDVIWYDRTWYDNFTRHIVTCYVVILNFHVAVASMKIFCSDWKYGYNDKSQNAGNCPNSPIKIPKNLWCFRLCRWQASSGLNLILYYPIRSLLWIPLLIFSRSLWRFIAIGYVIIDSVHQWWGG